MSGTNTEELDLEYTKSIRRKIVDKFTKDGAPEDPKACGIILQALDGMDRASLTKLRIKADEGIGNSNATAVATLANLFMNPGLKKAITPAPSDRVAPILADGLEAAPVVDGELAPVGTASENYDGFMARMSQRDDL